MWAIIFVTSDEKQQDMSLSISTNGNASITVSVEVNGTIYSGLYVRVCVEVLGLKALMNILMPFLKAGL